MYGVYGNLTGRILTKIFFFAFAYHVPTQTFLAEKHRAKLIRDARILGNNAALISDTSLAIVHCGLVKN